MTGKGFSSFFHSVPGALSLFALYGFAHGTLRLAASWNLGENDPLSALNAQSYETLAASGAASFDILVFLVSKIFGPTALVFQILRYGLLTAALGFVFAMSRRISKSGFWALLTVESYALIYQVSWRLHEGFTHPLVAVLAVCGLSWALLHSIREPSGIMTASAFVFAALGGLTGVWFAVFLLSLLIALSWSQALPNRRLPIAAAGTGLAVFIARFYAAGESAALLSGSAGASGAAAGAVLKVAAYFAPLVPVILLVFMPATKGAGSGEDAFIALVRRASLAAVFILVGGSLALGRADFAEHALMPVFFLTPIWLIDRIRRNNPPKRRIEIYAALCLSLMAVAFLARAANLFVYDPVCRRCYFAIPYSGLAEALKKDATLAEADTVVTPQARLSGNLYTYWPEKDFAFPVMKERKNALFVWPASMDGPALEEWLERQGLKDAEIDALIAGARLFEIGWPHLWRETGYRKTAWRAAVLRRAPAN